MRRDRSAWLGAGLVTVLVLVALLGPLAVPHDPNQSDFLAGCTQQGMPAGPSAAHWLGTDTLHRDVLSRLVHGARISLLAALLSTALSIGIGALVGMAAGACQGSRWAWFDSVLMRIVDAGLSFPYLLLVMALGAAIDRTDLASIVVVLGLTNWLGTSRVVRAKTIQVKALDYVTAARALGQRSWLVFARHVFPNVAGPLVVTASASIASMILAESVLSYLSVGVQPPTATWGRMLREGQTFFAADPRLVLAPGLAILLAVFGFNLLGEALRDALDPRG